VNDLHRAVYLRAREYWNTRLNDIHVPLSYLHARQLLLAHPTADADVVIPAVLMHDNGWKSIPENQQLRAFGHKVEDESLRRFHETEGARIAGEILSAVGYHPVKRETIMRIIDGHDSRLQSLSLEDSLVKDADKIWRFTPAGMDIDHRRYGVTLARHLEWTAPQLDRIFFTEPGRAMARAALAEVQRALAEVGHV
jgi:hypothetical protein